MFQTRMATQSLYVDKWHQSIAFNGLNPKSSDSFALCFPCISRAEKPTQSGSISAVEGFGIMAGDGLSSDQL